MWKGLITVSPEPDKERVWDPATARPLAVLDDVYEAVDWSRDRTTFATGFSDAGNPSQRDKFGVSLLRSGKKRFIPTDQEVKEIRLNPDGDIVFARTEAGWAAWDTSNGASLPADALPPAEMDFRALDSRDVTSPDGKFRIVHQHELVDAASGRTLVKAPYLCLSYDSSYVWAASGISGITVWDAPSGQELWTATANDVNGEDFLFMQFPDGQIRLSQSAEKLVKLVRGFQVRPFDDAARWAFVRR
jgi:WD40 repeat protein